VAWLERCQTLAIEHTDQGRYRVARASPSQAGSLDVRVAIRHRVQNLRASNECGWQTECWTEALQVQPLFWTERSERVLLNARHVAPPAAVKPASTPGLPQLYQNAKTPAK